MLTNERFHEILEALFAKTKQGKVRWQKDSDNSFKVVFPGNAHLSIAHDSPEAEPDWVDAYFYLGEFLLQKEIAEDGDPKFDWLKELFLGALNSVSGVDSLLENIEHQLASDQVVGV